MQVLELVGVFAFAGSGALIAIRRDFDVVGIAILAVVTALGGGIVRDLVLGDMPPPAFTRWQYLVVALAAAAVTSVAHPWADGGSGGGSVGRGQRRPPGAALRSGEGEPSWTSSGQPPAAGIASRLLCRVVDDQRLRGIAGPAAVRIG